MNYHLVFHRKVDFDAVRHESDEGQCPRHAMDMMASRLDAAVHMPGGLRMTMADRLASKVFGNPEIWALARSLRSKLSSDDVIYCSGEDVGLPMAAICGGRPDSPRIAFFAHNVNRPRTRLFLEGMGLSRRIDLFFTNSKTQIAYLRNTLGVPDSKIHLLTDQTDVKFFTPGPVSPGKTRPIISSVGLEKRDYRTLAEATHDLDVDVRISGASQDAAVMSRAFPDKLPANMTQKFYSWPDLVQLYRDSDAVAVSLFPCEYAAGITTLMEASACRRPVIVTRTNGIDDHLEPDSVLVTEPGNAAQLRAAIVRLLENPELAESLADRGYEIAHQRHDSDRFVDEVACGLEEIATPSLSHLRTTLSFP